MIGLFGGSFNPIHIGHLRIAEDIREYFKLSKIVFIPAYQSPLKERYKIKDEDRLKMLKLSVKYNPNFDIDEIEINKGGKSFTIDTILYYKNKLGYNPIFIVGSDAFLTLDKWKEPLKLLDNTNFIVVSRDEDTLSTLKNYLKSKFNRGISVSNIIEPYKAKVYFFKGRRLDISATEIRNRIKEEKPITYLVLPEVEIYIRNKNLYKV